MGERGAWVWTRRQRAVLAGVVLVAAGWMFVRAVREPARVDDPPGVMGELAHDLATRIDPNLADAAEWAALPGIGEKRAAEIVAYRAAYVAKHPGEAAFAKPADLENVKGIGKATVEALAEHLLFPEGGPGVAPKPP
jgi:competence protein ComEA